MAATSSKTTPEGALCIGPHCVVEDKCPLPCNNCSCATASTTSNCKYCKHPTQTKPATAAALLMALLSNVSKEPVEMIAVDTGAGEHFVKPGHAKLLSGLQRSGVSAIGVSGAPIKAPNQGRLLVKLLDKRSRDAFTMDLGLGYTFTLYQQDPLYIFLWRRVG